MLTDGYAIYFCCEADGFRWLHNDNDSEAQFRAHQKAGRHKLPINMPVQVQFSRTQTCDQARCDARLAHPRNKTGI